METYSHGSRNIVTIMSLKHNTPDSSSHAQSIEQDVYPNELVETEQWILADTSGNKKQPAAPWIQSGVVSAHDTSHHAPFETADKSASTGYERGFVFTEDDPFVLIDFDDARDDESGDIDPAVAEFLERAGSYADVSTSGTGVHVIVRGELPDGVKTVNDSFGDHGATIEVYDNKQFGVMTGQHIIKTPTQCTERQELLNELADERRSNPESTPDEALRDPTRSQKEVSKVTQTSNPDVIWDAVKHTDPSDVRWRSDVTEKRNDGTKSRDPSWEHSDSGTRIGEFDTGFVYRKGMIGLDVLQMAALEERIITSPSEYPDGEDYLDAVDALRERGADIPEFSSESYSTELTDIDDIPDISLGEQRERARERGLNWLTTEEVRDRAQRRIHHHLKGGMNAVIRAPTAAGKTHTVATEEWTNHPEVTGGAPIVHLSKTTDARDEAYQMSVSSGLTAKILKSSDTCPVASGRHDSGNGYGNEVLDDLVAGSVTISEWIQTQTERKKIPFGRVHNELNSRCQKQYGKQLPCCRGEQSCQNRSQWDDTHVDPDTETDDTSQYDIIHATHAFAHVTKLIEDANVVFDERPEFTVDASQARLQDAIESFLQEVGASPSTWEEFITIAIGESPSVQFGLRKAIDTDPGDDWYLDDSDAHVYAPAIARALVDADGKGNGRFVGREQFQPFYREETKSETHRATAELKVVITDDYTIRSIHAIPPLRDARCIIGLDARPTIERWRLNTIQSLDSSTLLSDEERRQWRVFERGLLVVQIGNADRAVTRQDALHQSKAEALVNELTEAIPAVQTAITSKAAKDDITQLLPLPSSELSTQTLHYGEEKSRNDFAGEQAGLLIGCIDPGDDPILDWLALLNKDASPERSNEDCDDCDGDGCSHCTESGKERARGRGFEGVDADTATALLESVREMHVAQSIGRYARTANPDEFTVVFAWTDAIPDDLVDITIPDVRCLTDTQHAIVEYIENQDRAVTTREIASELSQDIVKETARQLLEQLEEFGHVTVQEGAGKHGAHLYDVERTVSGLLDV